MQTWDDLVKTALIGTDRQNKPLAPIEGKLGEVVSRIPPPDAAGAFLSAAAVVRLYDQAGRLPPMRELPTAVSCPHDDLPLISSRTIHFLKMMIGGEYPAVLPEALSSVAAAQKRLPADLLPSLLETARTTMGLREPVLQVLGPRGRWLAGQNPGWATFASSLPKVESLSASTMVADAQADESLWQTGGKAARLALLKSLRRIRPVRARLLLESTWSAESADDRAELLGSFIEGLSADDEALLESALDDRGRDVRRVAADLLAHLPHSALVARMTERAAALLAWAEGRRPHVEVTLPPEPDKSAQRDGIEIKPFKDGLGQRQWWLFQLVAAVPPSVWSDAWHQSPQTILAATKGEWTDLLHEAWLVAADRFRDAAWVEALWPLNIGRHFQPPTWPVRAGLSAFAPARQAELLAQRVRSDAGAGKNDSPTLALLRMWPVQWTDDLSRAILDLARRAAGESKLQGFWTLKSALSEFAVKIPTALLTEAADGWPTEAKSWDQWKSAVEHLIATLHFRHDFAATL